MPRRQPVKNDSFWVSYSDLATGLMIVFMVVTLIMVALVTQSSETQQEAVRQIVVQLRVILNTRAQLADSIRQAFGDEMGVDADPITAQLDVDDSKIRFERGMALLQPKGKTFLADFTPTYLCAIWHHEQAVGSSSECVSTPGLPCPRLDPEEPGGVRQIQVSGHADHDGTPYESNHTLSAARAEVVVQYMVRILKCASGGKSDCSERVGETALSETRLPQACEGHEGEVLTYAQERLWAIGTGDSEHCQQLMTANSWTTCYGDGQERDDSEERKVTFGLQVTGDDMTGLLQHVERLQRTVDLEDDLTDGNGLSEMTAVAASACWKDMDAYHGCDQFLRGCLGESEEGRSKHCEQFESLRGTPPLAQAVRRACAADPRSKGCGGPPQ